MPTIFDEITSIIMADQPALARLTEIGDDAGLFRKNRGRFMSMIAEGPMTPQKNEAAMLALQKFLTFKFDGNFEWNSNIIYFLFIHLNVDQQKTLLDQLNTQHPNILEILALNIMTKETPIEMFEYIVREIMPTKEQDFKDLIWHNCIAAGYVEAHVVLLQHVPAGAENRYSTLIAELQDDINSGTIDFLEKKHDIFRNYWPYIRVDQCQDYLKVLDVADLADFHELIEGYYHFFVSNPDLVINQIQAGLAKYRDQHDLSQLTKLGEFMFNIEASLYEISSPFDQQLILALINDDVLRTNRVAGSLQIRIVLFRALEPANQRAYIEQIRNNPDFISFVTEVIKLKDVEQISQYALNLISDVRVKESMLEVALLNNNTNACRLLLQLGMHDNRFSEFVVDFINDGAAVNGFYIDSRLEIFKLYLLHCDIPRMQALQFIYFADKYLKIMQRQFPNELYVMFAEKYKIDGNEKQLYFLPDTAVEKAESITKEDVEPILRAVGTPVYTEPPVYVQYDPGQTNHDIFRLQFKAITSKIHKWAKENGCINPLNMETFWENIDRSIDAQPLVAGERPPVNMYYAMNFNADVKLALEKIYYYLQNKDISKDLKVDNINELLSGIVVCGPGSCEAIEGCVVNFQSSNLHDEVLQIRRAIAIEAFKAVLLECRMQESYVMGFITNRHYVRWLYNMLSRDSDLNATTADIAGDLLGEGYQDPMLSDNDLKNLLRFETRENHPNFSRDQQRFIIFKNAIFAKYSKAHDMFAFVDSKAHRIMDAIMSNPAPIEQQTDNPSIKKMLAASGLLTPGGKLLDGLLFNKPETDELREILAGQFVGDWRVILASSDAMQSPDFSQNIILFEADEHNKVVCRFIYDGKDRRYAINNPTIATYILDNDQTKLQDIFNAIMPPPDVDLNLVRYYLTLDMMRRGYLHTNGEVNEFDQIRQFPVIEVENPKAALQLVAMSDKLFVYFEAKDIAGQTILRSLIKDNLSANEYELLKRAMQKMTVEQTDSVINALVANNCIPVVMRLYQEFPGINLVDAFALPVEPILYPQMIDFMYSQPDRDKNLIVLSLFDSERCLNTKFGVEILAAAIGRQDFELADKLRSKAIVKARQPINVTNLAAADNQIIIAYKILLSMDLAVEDKRSEILRLSLELQSPILLNHVVDRLISMDLMSSRLLFQVFLSPINLYLSQLKVENFDRLYDILANKSQINVAVLFQEGFNQMRVQGGFPDSYFKWWDTKQAENESARIGRNRYLV